MTKHNPYTFYLILTPCLVVLAVLLLGRLRVPLLVSYLASISGITFLIYGFDKARAAKNQGRVPEMILQGLALAGGTPGAFFGQLVFRHKIRKWKFRIVFILIFLLQIGALIYYWKNLQA